MENLLIQGRSRQIIMEVEPAMRVYEPIRQRVRMFDQQWLISRGPSRTTKVHLPMSTQGLRLLQLQRVTSFKEGCPSPRE